MGLLEVTAHGMVAMAAIMATPAGHMMGHHDALAGPESSNPASDFHDFTHQFMPEDHWCLRQGAADLKDVGAADAAGPHLQEDLSGRYLWEGEVFDLYFVGWMINGGTHGFLKSGPLNLIFSIHHVFRELSQRVGLGVKTVQGLQGVLRKVAGEAFGFLQA